MIVEIIVSATNHLEIAATLRHIAHDIERESHAVTHWGGHVGKPGSYSVTITDPIIVRDDL